MAISVSLGMFILENCNFAVLADKVLYNYTIHLEMK